MLRESEAYGPSSFQSTLSMRRATPRCHLTVKFRDIFQSTLSMRRATTNILPVWGYEGISIHALHEESDELESELSADFVISIHALHEESDAIMATPGFTDSIFQSTLSMRRATVQLDIFVRFLRRKPAA